LWPAHPENIAKYEEWLRDARALIDGRPADERNGIKAKPGLEDHKRKLIELEARALPQSEELSVPHEWSLADSEDRWWHAQLTKLIADLEAFADAETGLCSSGTTAEHGWGIEKRAEFARTIEERSVLGADAARRWSEAIDSISYAPECPLYEGLVISPELGLLPIGADPESGLWEFAHLQSGEPAKRGVDGKLVLTEETGLVFVLIPGGTFAMGAQSTDPTGENNDPQASSNESPVHEVTLAPYFLSKYEMTQGQWERFTGRNPSQYDRERYSKSWNSSDKGWSSLHPVEQVSWDHGMETLARMGMTLPTEAQWERACRAGTTSVYWSGDEKESLQGVANLSDAYGKSHGNENWSVWESWLDDGNTVHAAVGSYRPNPFGLHDVHGNVWEWCRDGTGGYNLPARKEDGERLVSGPRDRVNRGGGFNDDAAIARSAVRSYHSPGLRSNELGLRPARRITTP